MQIIIKRQIDHFTVVFLVTWPLSGSEAEVDLVMIQTLELFKCKSSWHEISIIMIKGRKACIKARSPPASLSIKGKVTKYATVKWTIPLGPRKLSVITCQLPS